MTGRLGVRAPLALAGALLAGLVAVTAQRAAVLREVDYVDIQNAYGRNLEAALTGDGRAFAATFTPDGELAEVTGIHQGTEIGRAHV